MHPSLVEARRRLGRLRYHRARRDLIRARLRDRSHRRFRGTTRHNFNGRDWNTDWQAGGFRYAGRNYDYADIRANDLRRRFSARRHLPTRFRRANYLTRLQRAPRIPQALSRSLRAQKFRLRRASAPRPAAYNTLPNGPPVGPSIYARAAPYLTAKNALWAAAAVEVVRFGYKGGKWALQSFNKKYHGKKVKAPSWTQFF